MYRAYLTISTGAGVRLGLSALKRVLERDLPVLRFLSPGLHLARPVLRLEYRWADEYREAETRAYAALTASGYQVQIERNSKAARAVGR
jgi:hypothetical protein